MVYSRFYFKHLASWWAYDNPLNKSEWDNLPAQRCFWYQVQKVTPAQLDPRWAGLPVHDRLREPELEAKTLLNVEQRQPRVLNAALICPYVVNVIPQTFFVRWRSSGECSEDGADEAVAGQWAEKEGP